MDTAPGPTRWRSNGPHIEDQPLARRSAEGVSRPRRGDAQRGADISIRDGPQVQQGMKAAAKAQVV